MSTKSRQDHYTYNGNRQPTSIKTPGGLTATNIYFSGGDSANRLEKIIDIEIGRSNSWTYAGDLVFSHTDERGVIITNYWDGLSRFVGAKYPDGTTTSNIYTALDITAIKDRLGYWSYASYNGIRQRVAETNANNVVTRYGYCTCGALLYVTNAWGTSVEMVTGFDYDFQGNRKYTYFPDATVTNWFDSLQRLVATCDAWGCEWFGYNNQGLLIGVTNAFGTERITTFDIEDRAIYVTDDNAVTVTNTYDLLGRLATRTYPDSGIETFNYSARGLITYTNQLNLGAWYAYDEASRKIYETNANSEVIRYTNNAAGDLLSLTDGKNQTTRWNYDEYGRVTNKLDQASVEILRYKYDSDDRLTNRWSLAMADTKHKHDAVGNLTNVDYPAGTTDIKYGYDALNRVTNMVDAAGTTKYTYAIGGQLYTEDGPFANDTVTNTYNNRLRTRLVLRQPTGVWTNAFAYDAAKRLTNVTSPAGAFGYTYHASRITLPIKLALPNTSYITNTYDTVARLLSTTLKNSTNGTLNSHTYAYNSGNQRTQQVFNAGSTYNYAYDPIGQLKVADSATASEDRGYVYDEAWNLNYRTNNASVTTFTVNGLNEVTNVGGSAYKYDGNGNLTNYNSGGTKNLTYDAENQLSSWDDGTVKYKLVYDGRGRLRLRQQQTWDAEEGWVPVSEVDYVYDGMRVIQERHWSDYGGEPVMSYTRGSDLSATLEGAGGIGGLLGRSEGDNSTWTSWSHAFYHADGNGNITYLVNTNQAVVASYRYDPYGNTISSSGTLASANTYRFSSKEIMPDSGLYYYGYRWYDPNLQRWPSRDPLGDETFQKPSAIRSTREKIDRNLYYFVMNNPIRYWDYLGLDNPGCDGDMDKPACPTKQERECRLRACAQHDKCYYDNGCDSGSWKWTWLLNWLDGLITTPCQNCNNDVIGAFIKCKYGAPSSGPRWFCPNRKHKGVFYDDYSKIPVGCWEDGVKPPPPF